MLRSLAGKAHPRKPESENSGVDRPSNILEMCQMELNPLVETTIPEGIPERTLGWAILAWAGKYLLQPDGGNAGDAFVFTREQVRIILWWYAVDENGHFLFTSGVIRRMKGWGKDPFAAAMCLIEFCGPVVFSHFVGNIPIGKPHPSPWIQVAAVSRDQTKNTFTLFPTMVSAQLRADCGVEVHKEIIHKATGGRIEAVTSSPKSLEGGRAHFVVMNETQFWLENNNGHEMKDAIAGNSAKGRVETPFRRLSICNAHRPGENSVAEEDYETFCKIVAGTTKATKFMYDAREASPDTSMLDEDSLRKGIAEARGDSVWLDIDRLIEEIWDPRTPPSEARRKYLNQIVAAEDAWLTPQQWDALANNTLKLRPGDAITLGFDGSRGNDHTALCACRVEDGALFLLASWNPKTYPDGKVPSTQVDKAVRGAFAQYNVVSFRADVKEFEAYIDQWTADFHPQLVVKASPGTPIAYDMRSKGKREFPKDCESFESAVIDGAVQHDGNRTLRQQILNARRAPNNDGVVGITKESRDSSRKIDAAVTAVLAWSARQQVLKGGAYAGPQEVGIF